MFQTLQNLLYAFAVWYVIYPVLYLMISAKSLIGWWKSRVKPARTHFDGTYDGAPILMVVLYQKGRLREDIIALTQAAKARGMYIMGVNTLAVGEPEALRDHFDCYIERPNFGRDFGSYKTGFLHLFDTDAADACDRLIMCNDSVYYTKATLDAFIGDLVDTELEVLGSTENFEYEYHLGSFCISLSGEILRDERFRKYWRNYRLTDVRPRVIRKGEMDLSKVLKTCVSSADNIGALYNASRYHAEITGDGAALDTALDGVRRSGVIAWRKFDPRAIDGYLNKSGLVPNPFREPGAPKRKMTVGDEMEKRPAIADYKSLEAYLLRHAEDGPANSGVVRDAVVSELVDVFLSSSQIHNSAIALWKMGLPIVKLDALYRGVFGVYDVHRLCEEIGGEDGRRLFALLVSRPFGGETFRGLKRWFFNFGLV